MTGVGVAVGVGEGAAVAVGELLAPVPVVVEPHAARINRLAVAPKKTRCRFMVWFSAVTPRISRRLLGRSLHRYAGRLRGHRADSASGVRDRFGASNSRRAWLQPHPSGVALRVSP